jgi:hypothetical protein
LECAGDGVTSATLTFLEDPSADPNDYTVTAVLVGGPAGSTVDEIQVSIDGVSAPGGYSALPTLSSAPGGPGAWSVAFDVVPGCAAAPLSGNSFCAQSAGLGPAVGTNTWVFAVNLVDAEGALGVGSNVNFRAQFVDATGKNTGILSPDGGDLGTTSGAPTTTGTPTTGSVPEPTILALFGAVMVGAAYRLRRQA